MATEQTVNIQRQSVNQPWGMKICGGRDFRMQLQVKKVEPNTPAAGNVHNGDAIIAIGGTSADKLSHMQAHQLIKSAGNHLQLTVLPGHFEEIKGLKPKGPVKFSPWRNKQQ
ncbi:PDZ and LIM domain protein 1-like [Mya arenaria]|uniref:PDZ and LIM domain protein 1-like n=1 Tax=Mya arenaria TaxID=6604 RepID=UPI0022E26CD3|nr:PDZ and LIM domain protein 1-like [Mya arenaria]